ncbi:hypothetical protein [Ruminiclostridium josui]|uniref:hypothetical protein n=1 Tax=Ruminiclostridium josui TaxID=1499 RepID=UPI000B15CB5A|nr:hypothetical protein [Ruminiclostridium josui]
MKVVCVCNGSISNYDKIKKYILASDYIISVDGGPAPKGNGVNLIFLLVTLILQILRI